jgi:hypothetical protein
MHQVKCRFISAQPQLPLKFQTGKTFLGSGHQQKGCKPRVQGKITGFHHSSGFKGGPSSALAAFEEFSATEPVVFGKRATCFTVDTCFFSVDFKKFLTTFLIWEMGYKINDVHGLRIF